MPAMAVFGVSGGVDKCLTFSVVLHCSHGDSGVVYNEPLTSRLLPSVMVSVSKSSALSRSRDVTVRNYSDIW